MSRTGEITRVLIPGVCHPIASEALESLRRAADDTFHIVGVDVEERGADFDGIDKHYFVPAANSPEYIPAVLDICRKEQVDVVVPWSDDEVEAISSQSPAFQESGIVTLCGLFDSVRRTLDKGTTLQGLEEKGVPVPAYELASSSDDVERAATILGYPEKQVVVKPCRSHGCLGLWILNSDADVLRHCAGPGRRVTLSALLAVMRDSENAGRTVPDYVVMEFLPGADYSVDALADEGNAVFVVPRRRIRAVAGVSHIGEIGPNPEVRAMVARAIEAFGLHLNVNVQLRYSDVSGGSPLIYEINPRVS